MSALLGDLRPYVLLTLWLAKEGGEATLDRTTLLQRIRTSAFSDPLIESAIADLKRIDFVKSADGADSSYALTSRGEDWLADRYELSNARETRHFAFKRGGSDLPAPGKEYLERLPRMNWVRFWVAMAFFVAVLFLSSFIFRRG